MCIQPYAHTLNYDKTLHTQKSFCTYYISSLPVRRLIQWDRPWFTHSASCPALTHHNKHTHMRARARTHTHTISALIFFSWDLSFHGSLQTPPQLWYDSPHVSCQAWERGSSISYYQSGKSPLLRSKAQPSHNKQPLRDPMDDTINSLSIGLKKTLQDIPIHKACVNAYL